MSLRGQCVNKRIKGSEAWIVCVCVCYGAGSVKRKVNSTSQIVKKGPGSKRNEEPWPVVDSNANPTSQLRDRTNAKWRRVS